MREPVQTAAPPAETERFLGHSVVSAGGVDVGIAREHLRRRRLWILAAVLAVPTAFLLWRLYDGRPFNVFAVPTIDWVVVTPILFFVALIVFMVVYYAVSGRSPHVIYRPEQLDVRLADVVGIDAVREEVIRSLNLFLAHKTFAAETGGRVRRGLLFEGPPGTGKTYIAKAVAAEAGVPFLFATATSFQSSFYGATARKIRSYFKTLRAVAQREGGAIGFIDEFDAIAGRRGGMEFSALPSILAGCGGMSTMPATYRLPALQRNEFGTSDMTGPVVNELLVQLQSFDQPTGLQKMIGTMVDKVNLFLPPHRQLPKPRITPANIMLIASTNRADGLDPALLRPGRFDRKLAFELPDRAGRRALVDHFLTRKSHAPEMDAAEQRDILAGLTQGYSPAMIEGLFDEALVNAVARGDKAMNWLDIEQARLTEEIGLGQPVGYTAHEKRLIATHESGHATVAWLVAPERRLEVLSIIKRKDALGMLAHGDKDDVFTRSRSEMLALIQIAMAGQCAEAVFFGDISTGPGGDLLYATNVAAQMVGACGMSGSLVSYAAIQTSAFNDNNLVGRVLADGRGRDAVEALLQEQKAVAKRLIESNRHLVEALRDALLDRHELVGPEITDILAAAATRPATIDLRDPAATLPK
ncbi:MAG: AAA family ATPase [Actinomycetota bacterium]|nr:AAA family ATPase [Actinomycetota bacterium]